MAGWLTPERARPSAHARLRTPETHARGSCRGSLHDDSVACAAAEALGLVHLLGLGRWHDERTRRRRAGDEAVVVRAAVHDRRERLDALVAQVLMFVPRAAPPPRARSAGLARL